MVIYLRQFLKFNFILSLKHWIICFWQKQVTPMMRPISSNISQIFSFSTRHKYSFRLCMPMLCSNWWMRLWDSLFPVEMKDFSPSVAVSSLLAAVPTVWSVLSTTHLMLNITLLIDSLQWRNIKWKRSVTTSPVGLFKYWLGNIFRR